MSKFATRSGCLLALPALLALAGCATGAADRADTYSAAQVNTRQAAHVVNILAVLPAKVAVDNTQNQKAAEIGVALLGAVGGAFLGGGLDHATPVGATLGAVGGGAAGAAAGSLVPGQVLVVGVSITYEEQGQTYNSAQVGQACEYVPGKAIMVETTPTETRIQPNATCPVTTKT